jgi:hypothetical protein
MGDDLRRAAGDGFPQEVRDFIRWYWNFRM